jgi:hypothetical protein
MKSLQAMNSSSFTVWDLDDNILDAIPSPQLRSPASHCIGGLDLNWTLHRVTYCGHEILISPLDMRLLNSFSKHHYAYMHGRKFSTRLGPLGSTLHRAPSTFTSLRCGRLYARQTRLTSSGPCGPVAMPAMNMPPGKKASIARSAPSSLPKTHLGR